MRGAADILLRLLEGKTTISSDLQVLKKVLPLLSEATKQRIQSLYDKGISEPYLLNTILKNQKKLLEQPDESQQQFARVVEKAMTAAHKSTAEAHYLVKPKQHPSKTFHRFSYVLNSLPTYQEHEWLGTTPPLIQSLVRAAKKLPSAFWDHLHALHKIRNMRIKVSQHRVRAIQAILPCLCATMNVRDRQCRTNEQATAKQCGLTDSRASRALKDLADCGLITKRLTRNPKGTYQSLVITLNHKLLGLLGFSEKRLAQAQKTHQKLSKASSQISSLTQNVVCTVTHSLSKVKRAFKGDKSKPSHTNQSTNNLVQQVETLLQRFGLGKTENYASG